MFKLVVLCAFLAAAAAEPGLYSPVTYSGNYYSPVSTYPYYPSGVRSLLYSSPFVPSTAVTYSTPVTHFIKKRSVPLVNTYVPTTPVHSTYASTYSGVYPGYSPFATTYGATYPSLYSSPFYPAHLIKKRSAALLPVTSTYVTPTTYASTYTGVSPVFSPAYPYSSVASPYYTAGPYSWPAQFIKK